jgi:hypothetical protein
MDPRAALDRRDEGAAFTVEGTVVRLNKRTDRNGGRMWVVGLLGARGYLRFFVWASRLNKPDVKALKIGHQVRVRLEKLKHDGAALARAPVERIDPAT